MGGFCLFYENVWKIQSYEIYCLVSDITSIAKRQMPPEQKKSYYAVKYVNNITKVMYYRRSAFMFC